jgi:hypothetical protein
MAMELVKNISDFLGKLKRVRNEINKENSKTNQVNKKSIRDAVGGLCDDWFGTYRPELLKLNFNQEVLEKYDTSLTYLIKLALSAGNHKKSYLENLNFVTQNFNEDLIIKLRTGGSANGSNTILDDLLKEVKDNEENAYLKEAIDCAKSSFLKASIILGWCAGIDRIHKKIEKIGFVNFNVASTQIASATTGRFRRFNKTYTIGSLNELESEVFDNDILWVVEGMGLIDANQHTRLKSCFDMRNHSAHPGEAPITSYNLMSFFSDLNEIIFKNKKFEL